MHEAPLARYSDVHEGPTHFFDPISPVRGGEAGICAPLNSWYPQVADVDASDTESVGSVHAGTKVLQANNEAQAGPLTCRKANAGIQANDCFEA